MFAIWLGLGALILLTMIVWGVKQPYRGLQDHILVKVVKNKERYLELLFQSSLPGESFLIKILSQSDNSDWEVVNGEITFMLTSPTYRCGELFQIIKMVELSGKLNTRQTKHLIIFKDLISVITKSDHNLILCDDSTFTITDGVRSALKHHLNLVF